MRFLSLACTVVSVALAQPRFEVASVKPAPPDAQLASMNGGPMDWGPFNQSGDSPQRITWTNIRLKRMLQVAYDVPQDRISGPDWLDTIGYTVVATVPKGATVPDFRIMLQNLLTERFKLTLHHGMNQVSGYGLEIAKNGLKIKPSSVADQAAAVSNDDARSTPKRDEAVQYMATRPESFNSMVVIDQNGFAAPRPGSPMYPPGAGFQVTIAVNGRFRSTALNATMPGIAAFLGNLIGSPAEDQTGLPGKYDVHLEYVPQGATADPGPTVFDAVQEQLGLKLASKKVPVEMLVIDHAEKTPTED